MISQTKHSIVVERDVMVRMRDGVALATDIYRPARDGRFPAILVRTCYNKDLGSPGLAPGPGGKSTVAEYFTKNGYVFAAQDVRGRFKSEGSSWYIGATEVEDGYDTIEWIAQQPWSNGKIGMTGASYLAAVQTAAAISRPPHLASIFHVKAPSNYYQNGFRRGGTLLMYLMPIAFMMAATSKEAMNDPVATKALTEAGEKATQWLARMPLKKGLTPLAMVPNYERWLMDMTNHTDYDQYWKGNPLLQSIEYVDRHADVPGYYISGWYDPYCEDALYIALSKEKSNPMKLRMDPSTHGLSTHFAGDVDFGPEAAMSEKEYHALQLRWFDQTLKGINTGILDEPPVKIFVMGGGDGRKNKDGRLNHGGRWRFENEWPIARTMYTDYYLHADGTLSTASPAEDESSSTYVYDPEKPVPTIGGTSYFLPPLLVPGPFDQRDRDGLPLSSRHDILVFQTPPLAEDVEVTGPLTVKLWASSSAVDTDFTAKLIDVHPPNEDYLEGYAMNLSDGIIRARYRNSFEKAELIKLGEIYKFNINLQPTSNLFTKGHRIRLDVSSSNYPAHDPNPNTGDPYMTGGRRTVAENTIYHDAKHSSHIILPIIPARESG